jgi:hypothetical protein
MTCDTGSRGVCGPVALAGWTLPVAVKAAWFVGRFKLMVAPWTARLLSLVVSVVPGREERGLRPFAP